MGARRELCVGLSRRKADQEVGPTGSTVEREAGMRVREILAAKGSEVVTVDPRSSLRELAGVLTARRIGAAVVRDGEQLTGIISERDIVRAVARDGEAALTLTVEKVMVRRVVTCGADDTIDSLMTTMTEERIRHVPVLDRGRMVGIVSIGDVVKRRVQEIESEASLLRDYVQMR